MKPNVFISIGSVATSYQKSASKAIIDALVHAGLCPRRMERNSWDGEQPLAGPLSVLSKCAGALIIASRRYQISEGTELMLSAGQEGSGSGVWKPARSVFLPTVWNHIEAAIAYSLGLPVLVVAEEGLREDGVLEGGYDWQVHRSSFDPFDAQSSEFDDQLERWRKRVDECAARKRSLEAAAGAPRAHESSADARPAPWDDERSPLGETS